MSDARMATWAAPLPRNPCSVLGAHALFQLPPTSKHPRMGLFVCLHCLSSGTTLCPTRAGVPMPALSLSPNHVHSLLPEAPTVHNE